MKLNYRPEIDGLRAIAVCAVILYHSKITFLGYQPFKGGFIGVDIFFVISGYLITSIILKELISKGFFSFKYFYERRIRRILPALLFVMLVSLPFAWLLLLPINYIDFSKSILYSLGFTSNIYFHYSGQQYGAESGLFKPFLHTWSLSVEEQYYILFPIFLLITYKYLRNYLIHILILVFFIGLGLAEWASKIYPSFNFYFLPTRVWELLAGSILSYFEFIKGNRSKNNILNSILPITGLILITHSIFFFNDDMFHPSFYTLSPIIGVCLIIWFSNKNELITKILSSKLFVGIGLISYSLYLWHYPILAFARISGFTEDSLLKELSLGLIILIISILSYFFVEKPARNMNYNFKVIMPLIVISASFLLIINFNTLYKDGFKNKLPEIIQNNLFAEPWDLLKNSEGDVCFRINGLCKFNTSSNKKLSIVGDSHMASLTLNLKDRVVMKNYQFITSVRKNCLYYPGFNLINSTSLKINNFCNNNYFQSLKNELLTDKDSIIIFGGNLPIYLSSETWDQKFISLGKYDSILTSFIKEISYLSKQNKIILVYPIPEVGLNTSRNIYNQWIKQKFSKNFNLENITTSYEIYKNKAQSSFELLDSIKGDNIYRVYPHTLFCNTSVKNRCVTHDDNNIYYSDSQHLSLKGAEMVNDLIIKQITNIEQK